MYGCIEAQIRSEKSAHIHVRSNPKPIDTAELVPSFGLTSTSVAAVTCPTWLGWQILLLSRELTLK
jgi:hypothetical protein